MVVRDLSLADDHVVREQTAHRFVEPATDRLLRDLEIGPGARAPGMDLRAPALEKVERSRRRIRLEVAARAIALQGVGPARDLPLQLGLGEVGGLRQADAYALSRRFHPTKVHLAGERGDPEARERSAAAVEGKVLPGPAVEPAGRDDP